jgi:hypothetical protein
LGANRLLSCRFLGDNLVGLLIIPLPATLLLAGDDKDLLALPAKVPNVAQAARRE